MGSDFVPCFYRQNCVLELEIMSLDSNSIFAADLANSLYLSELHFCQSGGMMVGSKKEKHRRDFISFSILLSLRRLSEFLPFILYSSNKYLLYTYCVHCTVH